MFTWLVLWTLAGCSGGGGGGGGGGLFGSNKRLSYEEGNNYTYSGALTVEPTDIAAGADVMVDWSSLNTDIRGRPVDPAAAEEVVLTHFLGSYEAIRPKIEENDVAQKDAQDIYLFENTEGVTSALLSEFAITGIGMDLALLEENTDSTWFLSLRNVPQERNDILSSVRLVPMLSSDNDAVSFLDTSSSIDVDVDLHSAAPFTVKAGKRYVFDWTGAETDVFGHDFDDQLGDELIIAKHDTDKMADVEAAFLQLDTGAGELFRANVSSLRTLSLDVATDATGKNFAGFTEDGTWLVGIICSTCMAPVPLLLSVIEVK